MTFAPFGPPAPGPADAGPARGTGQLDDGMATVAAPSVAADSVIHLTAVAADGGPVPGLLYVAAVVPGTGFVVKSSADADPSSFGWSIA